jgi:hypothetical protein
MADRPLSKRADAARNRQRILEAARTAFAAGVAVRRNTVPPAGCTQIAACASKAMLCSRDYPAVRSSRHEV